MKIKNINKNRLNYLTLRFLWYLLLYLCWFST